MLKKTFKFKLGLVRNSLRHRIYYLTGDFLHLLPLMFTFKATYRCNLNCRMCQPFNNNNLPTHIEEMPLDVVKNVFTEIKNSYSNLGYLPRIRITGGEPFLREDMGEILMFLNKLGFKISLVTNGTLLNEKNVRILAGLKDFFVRVSIDGPGEIHDYIRNYKGCFRLIAGNIDNLLARGFPPDRLALGYAVSSMNSSKIIEFTETIAKFRWKTNIEFLLLYFTSYEALEELRQEGRKYFGVDNLISRMRETKLNYVDILVLTEQLKEAKLIARKNNFLALMKPDIPLHELEQYYYSYDGYIAANRCPEFKSHLIIHPDGAIFACGMIALELGNIVKEDLEEIFYSERAKKFRDILSHRLLSVCRRCCMLKKTIFY